jgi:S1-C subfamily serine protease
VGEVSFERVAVLVVRRLVVVAAAAIGAALVWLVGAATVVGAADDRHAAPHAVSEREPIEFRPFTDDERRAAVERLLATTVRVTGAGCGATTIGTGFAVDDLLLTNSHVVGDGERFQVDQRSVDGGAAPVRLPVTMLHPGIDGAAGPADQAGFGNVDAAPLRWADQPATAGQPVLLAGYGGGRRLTVLDATVHAVVDGAAYGNDGQVLLLDREVVAGFSGGPVVDRDGQVVGMVRAYDSVTGLSIATPTALLTEAADSISPHVNEPICN